MKHLHYGMMLYLLVFMNDYDVPVYYTFTRG